ncbi:hypothetical protein MJT46_015656 [Ovis ammon polii x Ovis aries]|nr:hypothetical protein MJT46_015656 [Ovis ammon polii x Ovis aries]
MDKPMGFLAEVDRKKCLGLTSKAFEKMTMVLNKACCCRYQKNIYGYVPPPYAVDELLNPVVSKEEFGPDAMPSVFGLQDSVGLSEKPVHCGLLKKAVLTLLDHVKECVLIFIPDLIWMKTMMMNSDTVQVKASEGRSGGKRKKQKNRHRTFKPSPERRLKPD